MVSGLNELESQGSGAPRPRCGSSWMFRAEVALFKISYGPG